MDLSDLQLNALCTLLEDEQPAVAKALDRQIAAMNEADQERLFERLAEVAIGRDAGVPAPLPPSLEAFHRDRLERAFSDWVVSAPGGSRLEEGIFLLASFADPLMDLSRCIAELDQMAGELAYRLDGVGAPDEVVRHTAYYLHEELGFQGDRKQYYDPDNCYLNRVLDRRQGIPISLSAVYLLIGQRLDLPFRGVGMPGHFILKYEMPETPIYLDPFDGGKIVSLQECGDIVRGMGYHFDSRFLRETPDVRIVERMLNNLIGIYHREGDEERSRRLVRYREIVQRG